MANINKIKAQGSIYDIEDTVARTSAVVMTSKPDGSVELRSPNSTVTVPSLTNFGDPSELENDVVTEISDLKSQISSSQGMSAEFKVALEDLVNQLVYKGDDPTGRTYINALHTAMYPPANLTSITAVYTQSGTVYDTDALDSLKTDLVVTARYDNGTTEILADSAYTLSGTLAEGTSAITVAYGGKTTTFNVTVSSLWLYKLASPFTSTDDSHLDTGVQLQTGKTYTFLVDFLLSATHSASGTRRADFIYSNKVGEDTAYIGLQTITTSLWGMGVPYSSAKTVAANKRYRNVAVVTVNADGSCSIANKNKNVTDGTAVQSATNTYATGNAITSATYFLGKANEATTSKAFTGTVNDFAIYDGEMSASEINDYLANGAS